jgi:dTDP-4-dehydrorhamnose 3,5-epimerase
MIFTAIPLGGAYLIELEKIPDDRGFFARTFCRREFEQLGIINVSLEQCSVSFNRKLGTLRGMHYQIAPHQEAKLVRCTAGAIHDVIIDLRGGSPTFRRWSSVELTADNHRMLYVPEGFAHGFITLRDNTEVFYEVSEFHTPGSERGIRWDDPGFAIRWPIEPAVMSERDRRHPDFRL